MSSSSNSNAPPLLTVSDAAERLRVTPRTLKYYEERGLVTPSRSEGRYRLYDEADIEQFARILRLRSLGFSLHGVTEMLKRPLEPAGGGRRRYSHESLQQIGAALAQQVQALDERIACVRRELKEAARVRAQLHDDLDYVQRRLAGENADQLLDERRAARSQRAREKEALLKDAQPAAPQTQPSTRQTAKPQTTQRAKPSSPARTRQRTGQQPARATASRSNGSNKSA